MTGKLLLAAVLGVGFVDARATCVPDGREADDTCAATLAFMLDSQVEGRNFCDDAVDWVSFHACPGRTYTVETGNLGSLADTVLELYDRDCTTLLATDDDGAGVRASRIAAWTAPFEGSFHVSVRQKDGTAGDDRGYDMTVAGDTSPCATWSRDFAPFSTTLTRASAGVVRANDGGSYILGTGNGGPFVGRDVWLARLDAPGSVSWLRGFDGGGNDFASGLARSADGGLLVSGSHPHPDSPYLEGVAAKIDASGAVVWVTALGGENSFLDDVAPVPDGGAVVAGSIGTQTGYNGWIARLSSSGGVSWSRSWGGDAHDAFYAVVPLMDGSFVAVGETESAGSGDSEGWLVRFDDAGNVLGQSVYGGSGEDHLYSGSPTRDGGMIAAGSITLPSGPMAGWIMKLDGTGAVSWQRSIEPGDSATAVNAVAALDDGGVVATASYSTVTGSSNTIWWGRLDATGALVWQKRYDGVGNAGTVTPLADGGFLFTGRPDNAPGERWIHTDAQGAVASCAALRSASAPFEPSFAVSASWDIEPTDAFGARAALSWIATPRTGTLSDYCPCTPPTHDGVLTFSKDGGEIHFTWTTDGAMFFDVVRGDLTVLRSSGGDFKAAMDAMLAVNDSTCMADDTASAIASDLLCCTPRAQLQLFYLIRPSAGPCPGTYDDGSESQLGGRDQGIYDSTQECP